MDVQSHLKEAPDRSDRETEVSSNKEARFRYDEFPVWGVRILALKLYMDQQRPSGLRGLWHDTRNIHAWWTFWAVLVFGVATLILTLISIGVSVAQTVASFKALELQMASSNPPAASG